MATTDGLRRVRRLLQGLTTPLLPDDYSRLLNPLWTTRELRGKILRIDHHDPRTASLDIQPGWGVPVDFHAGQYIGIGLAIDGRYTWRSYSLTCAPTRSSGLLTITVRAVDGGKLSSHLVSTAHPGMTVRLAAPAGDFYLPYPIPPALLFVTAGTGITPVIGMLRDIEDRLDPATGGSDVWLVHSARTPADVLFAAELDRLEAKGLKVHRRITSVAGRVTPEELETIVPGATERAVYACGPAEMLQKLEGWAADKGVNLKTERFTISRDCAAEGGTVTFEALGEPKTATVDGATTVLEAGESVGVQLPFGCRMGICQTCVQSLSDGYVIDLRTGEEKGPGERFRPCVCVPAGDIHVEQPR